MVLTLQCEIGGRGAIAGEGFGEILLNPQSIFRSNYFQTSLLQSVVLPRSGIYPPPSYN